MRWQRWQYNQSEDAKIWVAIKLAIPPGSGRFSIL
jgi:hypothetical protein